MLSVKTPMAMKSNLRFGLELFTLCLASSENTNQEVFNSNSSKEISEFL